MDRWLNDLLQAQIIWPDRTDRRFFFHCYFENLPALDNTHADFEDVTSNAKRLIDLLDLLNNLLELVSPQGDTQPQFVAAHPQVLRLVNRSFALAFDVLSKSSP